MCDHEDNGSCHENSTCLINVKENSISSPSNVREKFHQGKEGMNMEGQLCTTHRHTCGPVAKAAMSKAVESHFLKEI